jgi:hypothetical protein
MMEHNDIQRSSKNNSRKEQGVSNGIQVYDPKLFLERQKDSLFRSMVSNQRKLHSKSSNAVIS